MEKTGFVFKSQKIFRQEVLRKTALPRVERGGGIPGKFGPAAALTPHIGKDTAASFSCAHGCYTTCQSTCVLQRYRKHVLTESETCYFNLSS